ncbi:MAG: fumarylacetoacetate hydrolase family protein [Candidatus Aminicenantes bacterium]
MVHLPINNRIGTVALEPSKIICLGLNYREHIAESVTAAASGTQDDVPEEPILFPKTPNALIGPKDTILIPAFIDRYEFEEPRTDYEAELAVIIGRRCKNVPVENALEMVYGYTCLNDVSQRNIQTGDKSGWFRGKSLDTFAPVGPAVTLAEDMPEPQDLHIQCRLNGKTVQDSNTRHMIFSIPEIIAFVSMNFTLNQGDVIATGTPAGVGPLHDGDVVEVEIELIGVLTNPVSREYTP